jgi:hypothetical protein
MKTAPANFKDFACRTREDVREYNYVASGCSSATSAVPCAATTRLRPHALYVDLTVRRDYPSPAARALRQPCRAPRALVSRLQWLYITSAARPGASARHTARHAARRAARCQLLRLAHARRRLLHLRRASGCLGTSRGSSRGSSRRSSSTTPGSSSTTPPRAGSSSTTSPPPRGQVPRHVAWLDAWLVAPLVVDYFAYAARPGASARRAACHGGSSSTTPCAATSSYGHTGFTSATLCVATTCLAATLALLRVRRTPPRRRLTVASR